MEAQTRREILIENMDALEVSGFTCKGCSGTCCTFEANSMMVTPLEAVELHRYLKENHLLTAELKNKFVETVTKYRLDHQVGNGKRSYLRRTYTCPLFHHKELGCPLPREVKPYGCLAFNSYHDSKKADENCHSDLSLLKSRDEAFKRDEDNQNELLRKELEIYWEKSPLPTALLDIWDK